MKLSELSARTLKSIETVLDGFDGFVLIDEKGTILIIGDVYAELCGLNAEETRGRNIMDIFPSSRLMEVITTGKPIFADLWEAGPETVFVSRLPVVSDGRVIGALGVSVFRYMDEAKRFADRMKSLDRELEYYKSQVRKLSGARYSIDAIIGFSQSIIAAKDEAMRMARTRASILIKGETGTGKELFAHAIHQASPRRDRPFIRVNCASIPDHLAETELFGYEEGAFTGAKKGGKPGKFELAHGGTLFLDEINELPYAVQAKLLRVLQEGEVERVGGTETSLVDVRLISASGADLKQLVEDRKFRADLFYRINAMQLDIPPLRERLDDLPVLCQHFIDMCNYELGTVVSEIDSKALHSLVMYPWPGNVRELRNVIQRSCLNAGSGVIEFIHLPPDVTSRLNPGTAGILDLQGYMEQSEKEYLSLVLKSVKWNRNKAAEILGIHRSSLHSKMKKYQLLD